MASHKAEKPVGTQLPAGQAKKEPAAPKASGAATKAPGSTKLQATKKAEQKPREPKKKASGGKAAAKN